MIEWATLNPRCVEVMWWRTKLRTSGERARKSREESTKKEQDREKENMKREHDYDHSRTPVLSYPIDCYHLCRAEGERGGE